MLRTWDSPLAWSGAELARAADLFRRSFSDGPDALEPHEDPEAILRGFLADPALTRDPARCLHVGSLEGREVAVVLAQVMPASGWSSIFFLGLVPEARGQGLGHHVHRHGIAMLRAQGGREYHDGTSMGNAPMRACFARQGCREWRRFAEWRWVMEIGRS